MNNFSYLAFAFNRISLIGRDHPKLVEKMSNMKIRKYLSVTSIISISLSVVKGFKYRINYDHSELNYPYLADTDIQNIKRNWTNDLYTISNFISDTLNYVLFVLVNLIVDVYMLVRLRQTLNQKLYWFRSESGGGDGSNNGPNDASSSKHTKIDNQKEKDINEAMNNAIRMVSINSILNLIFKLIFVYNPIQNVITAFYYKTAAAQSSNLAFDTYIRINNEIDLEYLIEDMSEWLYNVLISIQFFIYLKFDKKLKSGFRKVWINSNDLK